MIAELTLNRVKNLLGFVLFLAVSSCSSGTIEENEEFLGVDEEVQALESDPLQFNPPEIDAGTLIIESGDPAVRYSFELVNTAKHKIFINEFEGMDNTQIKVTPKNCPIFPDPFPADATCELALEFHPDSPGSINHILQVFYQFHLDAAPISKTANGKFIAEVRLTTADQEISLKHPERSPSQITKPTFTVSGVSQGDLVAIHSDNACSIELGKRNAEGSTVDVTISNEQALKEDRQYQIYASVTKGVSKTCLTERPVSYFLDRTGPTGYTLELGSDLDEIDNVSDPSLVLKNGERESTVQLFFDASCTQKASEVQTIDNEVSHNVAMAELGSDGQYSIYAQLKDTADNPGPCIGKVSYKLDTGIPTPPVSMELISEFATETSPNHFYSSIVKPQFNISGLVEDDYAGIYADPSCSKESLIIEKKIKDSDQKITLTTALADATHPLYAATRDEAGNRSPCAPNFINYHADSEAPEPPSKVELETPLSSPGDSQTPTLKIEGEIVVGSKVTVYESVPADNCENPLAEGIATLAGSIELTTSNLDANKDYKFHARISDLANNTSKCSTSFAQYQYDTMPPELPDTITLISPSSEPNKATTPVFSISTVTPGDQITFFKDSDCLLPLKTALASSSSVTLSPTLDSGEIDIEYSFYVEIKDQANNSSGCSTTALATYHLDTIPPVDPVEVSLKTGITSPGNATTIDVVVDISAPGDTVELHLNPGCNDTTPAATGVVADGAASIELTTTPFTVDGTYNFYAVAIDSALNESKCSSVAEINKFATYVRDTTPPDQPVITIIEPTTGQVGLDTTPKLQFTSMENGVEVTLYSDASCTDPQYANQAIDIGQGTVSGSSLDITIAELSVEGAYSLYAQAEDSAGNKSLCSDAFIYTLDTTAPTVATAISILSPGALGTDTTPTIQLTVDQSDTNKIEIYDTAGCPSSPLYTHESVLTNTLSFDLPTIASDGTYEYYAIAEDAAKNRSACSTQKADYILDTTPPLVPSIALSVPANSPNKLDSITLSITGTDTVILYSGGFCDTQLQSKSATPGTTEFTVTNSHIAADGAFLFSSKSQDAAGNISACSASLEYALDTTIPNDASRIDMVNPASPIGLDTTPEVKIIASLVSGDYVNLYKASGCNEADLIGTSSTISGPSVTEINLVTSVPLVEGSYPLHTQTYDNATNTSGNCVAGSPSLTYIYDNTPPPVPSGISISAPGSAGNIHPTVALTGIDTDDTAKINVYDGPCGSASIYTETSDMEDFTITLPSSKSYDLYVQSEDAVGNKSACSTAHIAYLYDATPPIQPTLSFVDVQALDKNAKPTIQVSPSETNATVELYTGPTGCTTLEKSIANSAGGNQNIAPTNNLSDGNHVFFAKVIDQYGNDSGCSTSSLSYTLDTQAPAKPSLSLITAAVSKDQTPELTITTSLSMLTGESLKIYEGSCGGTVVASHSMTGDSTTQNLTSSSMSAGNKIFYASVTDLANNESVCSDAVNYTLDLTPPNKATGLSIVDPAVSPYKDATPTIRISGFSDSTDVTVGLFTNDDCTASLDPVTIVSTGTSTVDLTLDALSNLEYIYTLYAQVTDVAGNSICSTASVDYDLDAIAPGKPTSITVAQNPSTDDTPTIAVSPVEDGATVQIFKASCTGTKVGEAVASGTTINLDTSALSETTHNLKARVIDAYNNIGECSDVTLAYTVDQTITDPNPPSRTLPTAAFTNTEDQPEFTVSGVILGDTVSLYTNSDCSSAVFGSTVASGTSVAITSNPVDPNVTNAFYARSTDEAGNISACSSVGDSYTYDTSGPDQPTGIAITTPASTPYKDPTPTVEVTGIADSQNVTVQIFTDSNCDAGNELTPTQVVLAGNSTASITLDTLSNLDFVYPFYALLTDAIGNSTCSDISVSYDLDAVAPPKPNSITVAENPSKNTTPTVTVGAVANGDTVEIFSTPCTGTALASGTASGTTINLTSTTLTENTHTIHARAIDDHDNESACSDVSLSYIVDLTIADPNPPSLKAPLTSPSNTVNQPEVTVTGVDSGDTVSIYSNGTCDSSVLGSGVASGSTIDITLAVLSANTTYTLYSKSVDGPGNESACSSAGDEFLYDTAGPSQPSSVAITTPAAEPYTDDTPTLQVSGISDTTDLTVQVFTQSNCHPSSALEPSVIVAAGDSVANITLDELTDKEEDYDFHVQLTDSADNSTCSTNKADYNLDLVAPDKPTSITVAMNPSNDQTPEFTISPVEVGSTTKIYNTNCSGTALDSGVATSTSISLTSSTLSETTHPIKAEVIDAHGNVSDCSDALLSYVVDISIEDPDAPSRTAPVAARNNSDDTPTFSVSGVEPGDTVKLYSNATCDSTLLGSALSGGTSVSITTNALTANVDYSLYAQSSDAAGNTSACSSIGDSYTYDTVAPDELADLTYALYTVSSSQSPLINWTASAASDLDHYEITLIRNSDSGSEVAYTSTGTTASHTFTGLSLNSCETEAYSVSIRAHDTSGNISVITSGSNFTFDATPPTDPSSLAFDQGNSTNHSPTTSWTASTDSCGVDHYEIAIGTTSGASNTIPWESTALSTSTKLTDLSGGLSAHQDYYLSVKAFNTSQQESAVVSTGPFRLSIPKSGIFKTNGTVSGTNLNTSSAVDMQFNYSNTDTIFDSEYFNATGTSSEIKVVQAGDYFASFTLPFHRTSGCSSRCAIRVQLYKNNTAIPHALNQATYIRTRDGHYEASAHFAVLLSNLNANDILEARVEGTTSSTGSSNSLIQTDPGTLYLEKVEASREIFAALTNSTSNSADLNDTSNVNSADPLLWTQQTIDTSAFSHSNNSDSISLNSNSNYLMFTNAAYRNADGSGDSIDCNGNNDQSSILLHHRVNDSTITGGTGAQGYLRCRYGHESSSVHFSGMFQSGGGSQSLEITPVRGTSNGSKLMIDDSTNGSIFMEKLGTDDVISLSGTTLVSEDSQGFNPSSVKAIKWSSTIQNNDSSTFSHSTGSSNENITVLEDGHYFVVYNDYVRSWSTYVNNSISIYINGTKQDSGLCQSHYIRDTEGHNESSCSLTYPLYDLSANDVITIRSVRVADSGDIEPLDSAIVTIIKK